MKHKTPVIFARELAVAGIIRVSTVVIHVSVFWTCSTKSQVCKQGLGILANMLVLDFTIHYLQSGSACKDENTNLAKNSPEQHTGKNYNKMQETLLIKCQVSSQERWQIWWHLMENLAKIFQWLCEYYIKRHELFIWCSLAIEFQLIR